MISSNSEANSKECGCKGIRSCFLCRSSIPTTNTPKKSHNLNHHQHCQHHHHQVQDRVTDSADCSTGVQRFIYRYCLHCDKAWLKEPNSVSHIQQAAAATNSLDDVVSTAQTCCHDGEKAMELLGIHIVENFVTQEEETNLDEAISCTPFMKSQSGRQKQDFGPKVNFKKQKLKQGSFNGLPFYSRFLYQRMKTCKVLEEFEPVEMCNLEYASDRGAHIDPHFDDFWIWGERLVTLNLLSDSILSFTHDLHPDIVIQVPLLRRSLIVVFGPARYEWKHAIDTEHISGRRLATTFRELSDEFKRKGSRSEEGQELLTLALSFEGCAVGCAS